MRSASGVSSGVANCYVEYDLYQAPSHYDRSQHGSWRKVSELKLSSFLSAWLHSNSNKSSAPTQIERERSDTDKNEHWVRRCMESRSYVSQSTPCSTIKNIKKSHKKSAKEKLKRKNVHCPKKGEIKHENALSFDSPSPKHKSRAEVKRLSHGERREKVLIIVLCFGY